MNNTLIENITVFFKKRFLEVPIIINSPGRINLIGEHTDYNEGYVFPAAIDKGIIAAISKSKALFCTAYAYDKNEFYEFSLNKLSPIINGNWRNYVIGVVAELQNKGIKIEPFNLVFGGDIPNGAGLSSSAALENSIVFGLNELLNLNLTKSEMILISQRAEHHFAGVKCGIMDQYASMFGIENHALLLDCRTQEAIPFKLDFEGYQIVLINTNVSHNLVEAEYNDRRLVCEKVASKLKVKALRDATEAQLHQIKSEVSEADYLKALYIIKENKRVLEAATYIKKNNLTALGQLLYKAHEGMQHMFKISCVELDFLVDIAKTNPNVLGARMMGGGFGGCTINIIKKEGVQEFINQISKLYFEEFGIESSTYFIQLSEGTHVLNHIYQE